jgi:hypothetical protein
MNRRGAELSISPTPAPAAPPDWPAIDYDVFCPLCEYNLRGLIESRCPECGFRFTWPEMLDPNRRQHPYLFEHHPGHNVWSYFKTAIGACYPRTFWATLHPNQPSSRNRLLIYWAAGAVLCFLALATHVVILYASAEWLLQGIPWAPASLLDCLLEELISGVWLYVGAGILLFLGAWVFLTVLSLRVFWISMRRARVRAIHMLRCVLYSFDPFIWMLVAAASMFSFLLALATDGIRSLDVHHVVLLTAAGTLILLSLRRLVLAYRLYLRFDHPLATIIASQIIVLLIALNVYLHWTTRGVGW